MPHHERRAGNRAAAFREAARVITAWIAGRKIIYIEYPVYEENQQANSRWITQMPKRLSDIQLVLRGMRDADDIGVTQKDLENYQHELKAFGEAQIEDDILIALAGSAAYGRVDKAAEETDCVDDRDEAQRLIHSLKEENRLPEEEYHARALDFVDTFEKWIQHLAEILIEQRQVEIKEFNEFIQAHPELEELKKVWKCGRLEGRRED
ncbi:hypothetical protein ACFL1N_01245 [Thermodesulfobacteriota bacterium]